MQNGSGPAPQIPASCRTTILAGGAMWTVDEEVDDVVRQIDAFLTGSQGYLQLTADHRPIFFSRELMKAWTTAWAINRGGITTASKQDAAALSVRQGGR